MAEINADGYQTLRQQINSSLTQASQWDYLELQESDGTIVTRVSITGDSRAQWTTAETDQTQSAEITVSGSDSDITTTVTISQSVLKNTDSDGAAELHLETFSDVTLANDSDEATITHQVEVPQV